MRYSAGTGEEVSHGLKESLHCPNVESDGLCLFDNVDVLLVYVTETATLNDRRFNELSKVAVRAMIRITICFCVYSSDASHNKDVCTMKEIIPDEIPSSQFFRHEIRIISCCFQTRSRIV